MPDSPFKGPTKYSPLYEFNPSPFWLSRERAMRAACCWGVEMFTLHTTITFVNQFFNSLNQIQWVVGGYLSNMYSHSMFFSHIEQIEINTIGGGRVADLVSYWPDPEIQPLRTNLIRIRRSNLSGQTGSGSCLENFPSILWCIFNFLTVVSHKFSSDKSLLEAFLHSFFCPDPDPG